MGKLLKIHAIYPTAFWREPDREPSGKALSGIAITDLPTTPFTADSSPPSGAPGILTTFIAGDPAERTRPAHGRRAARGGPRRPRQVLRARARHRPESSSSRRIGRRRQWIGGAFTAYLRPGAWTRYGAALRTPVGRIHWAGTETATLWNGYFDGAVRSGEDAAAAVLALLGGPQPTEEPACAMHLDGYLEHGPAGAGRDGNLPRWRRGHWHV